MFLAAATSAWWWCVRFLFRVKFAEHGTEVCTTLCAWATNSRCGRYRRKLRGCLLGLIIIVIAAPRVFRRGKAMEKKWAFCKGVRI